MAQQEQSQGSGGPAKDDNDELELVIVDDTPVEDQHRRPLKTDPLETNDDEVEEYSAGVKKRFGEMRHAAHDARRAMEAAQRERDEATKVAKSAYEESKRLRQQLTYGEASYAGEVKAKTSLSIVAAQAKYKAAYESGDGDALSAAAVELSAATSAQQQAEAWERQAKQKVDSSLQEDTNAVNSAQATPKVTPTTVPKPDPRAMDWADDNKAWYGTDPVMTSLAYGVHEKLIKEGVHPIEDADEYYGAIDTEMRKRFPDFEWEGKTAKAPKAKQKATVAPVSRSGNGKQKVTLTASQVALAAKFGLTNEQYAREVVKLAQQEGE